MLAKRIARKLLGESDYEPIGKIGDYDLGVSTDGKFKRYDLHRGGPSGINVAYLTTKPDLRGNGVAFDGLYVSPDYRGKGLGKALLQKGLELHPKQDIFLRARPYKDKSVSTDSLVNLYQSVGFKKLIPDNKMDVKYPVLKYSA